jgi:hypothetical protein
MARIKLANLPEHRGRGSHGVRLSLSISHCQAPRGARAGNSEPESIGHGIGVVVRLRSLDLGFAPASRWDSWSIRPTSQPVDRIAKAASTSRQTSSRQTPSRKRWAPLNTSQLLVECSPGNGCVIGSLVRQPPAITQAKVAAKPEVRVYCHSALAGNDLDTGGCVSRPDEAGPPVLVDANAVLTQRFK